MFGGRPPGDRGRRPRPEHLRLARRVALQPARVPAAVPARRRLADAARLPLFTNFRSGARILRAADTIIGALPARTAARSRQAARAVARERRGRGHARHAPRRAHRGAVDRRAHRLAARRRRAVVGDRGAVPHLAAVLPAAAGVRGAGHPGRDRRARRGCCVLPRWSRCSRTRARRTTRWRAWRSPAS